MSKCNMYEYSLDKTRIKSLSYNFKKLGLLAK